jgi:hypothetical protein
MEPSIRRDRSLLGDCAVYLLSALDRGQNDINRPEEGSKAGTARCPAVPVTDALQFLNNGVDIVGQLNPRGIEPKARERAAYGRRLRRDRRIRLTVGCRI